mmetsp:Transcript_23283/g.28607  ORF Transcript_23283/g.28607 Transcript_23283/m.28607 type:complete len:1046 (+) Transcript_23283:200-3337(+)
MNMNVTPSLPKLLAALALGARSVNNLPLSGKQSNLDDEDDDDESDSDNDETADDEFSYQMAFPEFNSLCSENRSQLSSLLNRGLKVSLKNDEQIEDDELEFDDPRLWESAAEVCEVLLERVDIYIQNVKEGRAGLDFEQVDAVRRFGTLARNKAKGDFERLVGGIVNMEKPQITYDFGDTINNSRTEPFQPMLHPESSGKLESVSGPGLKSKKHAIHDEIVSPNYHYAHPYQNIIETLKYSDEQLECSIEDNGIHGKSGTLSNTSLSTVKGIWIDKEHDLARLVERINDDENEIKEIAIDLEAHSFRSFSGFVCTMQLSIPRPPVPKGTMASNTPEDSKLDSGFDFIIDTLALRSSMNKYFAPIFANPNIVKVMHGADSDIQWLQRDFSIYVVNLFDTGRASRCLPHFGSAGLAYLLRKYANVVADKKHQLSDWRQRPIPDEMLRYAASDTIFLLDIYDKLKLELTQYQNDGNDVSIKSVLDASKKVCLIRCDTEPFYPGAYKNLMSKRGKTKAVDLSQRQENVLKSLYDWRDFIARDEDESLEYVCGKTGMIRIATTCPESVSSLHECVNPMPPLVLKYSDQILRLVQRCSADKNVNPISNESKLISSPGANTKSEMKRSGMLSPVLGTEALYQQAGWTTSQGNSRQNPNDHPSSSSEASTTEIMVHSSNSSFKANSYTSHSLEMNSCAHAKSSEDEGKNRRGQSVDGMGAARVILNQTSDDNSNPGVEMQNKVAMQCASRIRGAMMSGNQNLLGLVQPTSFANEKEEVADGDENGVDEGMEDSLDDYKIPKSMKEIYQISNKNRRRQKKSSVLFENEHKLNCGQEKEEELKKAGLLLSRKGPDGTDYFNDTSTTKRQRTKSVDESTEKNDNVASSLSNKEDDIDLMTELGWVKDKEEAAELIAHYSQTTASATTGSKEEKTKKSEINDVEGISSKQQQIKSSRRDVKRAGVNKLRPTESSGTIDYSNTSALKIYDPNAPVSDNPFFMGAALSGGMLQQQHNVGKIDRKKINNRKGKKNISSGGNKPKIVAKSKVGQKPLNNSK